MKGCPAGRFGAQPPLAAALGAEMNRQGSLEVNWPQAKRDRPGPFALDQTTFQNEFILKSACAYRNKFDRHSRRNCKVPAAVFYSPFLSPIFKDF